MIDPVLAIALLALFAFGLAGQTKKKEKARPFRKKKTTGIPPTLQPPMPGERKEPPTVLVKVDRPAGGPVPEKVPRTYVPKGGWRPYLSRWSVSRANALLKSQGVMPGQALIETEPGTGYTVKFRGETGKDIGNPRLVRAVTAWRKT